jgi:hypothetical protein
MAYGNAQKSAKKQTLECQLFAAVTYVQTDIDIYVAIG